VRIGFFITARLKSKRLPKKLLKPLGDKSVFEHILERALSVRGVDEIVVCTSTNPQDDPLEIISTAQKIKCYRGSEDDVLNRLLSAAEKYKCEYMLLMTADNPLFSISHAEELVTTIRNKQADYYHFEDGLPLGTAPYAVARHTFAIINDLKEDTETEFWPEYLKDQSIFSHLVLQVAKEYQLDARLTLDYQEDYELFMKIYENYESPIPLKLKTVLHEFRENKDLLRINGDIVRSWLPKDRIDQIRSVIEKNKSMILQKKSKYFSSRGA
jgi:spore coat polysaccharide biosynthesis protein SpsF